MIFKEKNEPFDLYTDIVKELVQQGIAVFFVDKRGYGKSEGIPDFSLTSIQDSVRDACAAIKLLERKKEIDAQKIGIIGHSEGTIIAPMAKAKGAHVSFIVLLASSALSGIQASLEQQKIKITLLRYDCQNLEEVLIKSESILRMIQECRNDREALKNLNVKEQALNNSIEDVALNQIGIRSLLDMRKGMVSPHQRSVIACDPCVYLQKIDVPVLALFAENDSYLPDYAHKKALIEALKNGSCPDYQVKTIDGLYRTFNNEYDGLLAHVFVARKSPLSSYAASDGDWLVETAPWVLSMITKWIKEKTDA